MKTVDKYIVAAILLGSSLAAGAQEAVTVKSKQMVKRGDSLYIKADIQVKENAVKSKRQLVLTPVLESSSQKSGLPSVVINGKNRQKVYNREVALGNAEEGLPVYTAIKATKDQPEVIHYNLAVEYESWMDNSRLVLNQDLCGCGKENPGNTIPVSGIQEDKPAFAFVLPTEELVKRRAEEKTAYIIFKVDKWDILPSLYNNEKELAEIDNTISEVTGDKNVQLTGIALKGFASPEGRYGWNEILAKNRVEALRDYVLAKHNFGKEMISTESVPENWEGFKAQVEADMNIPSRDKVLEIIDNNAAPDKKEAQLQALGNTTYYYILNKLFPTLRRSDYKVSYTVRGFALEEAIEIIRTHPKQLSLAEMFAVGNSYPKGSKQYNETFYIAAATFPDEPVANINAANVALMQKDLASARKYLAKAGNSPEAIHANGILNMLEGNIAKAEQQLEQAKSAGVKEAAENLRLLRGE